MFSHSISPIHSVEHIIINISSCEDFNAPIDSIQFRLKFSNVGFIGLSDSSPSFCFFVEFQLGLISVGSSSVSSVFHSCNLGVDNFKICFVGSNPTLSFFNGLSTNRHKGFICNNLGGVGGIHLSSWLNKVTLKIKEETKNFVDSSTGGKILYHIDKNLSKMSPGIGNL